MPERIRYAWGRQFNRGIHRRRFAARACCVRVCGRTCRCFGGAPTRLPDASLEEDREGLAELVGKLATLVDHPEIDPGITP